MTPPKRKDKEEEKKEPTKVALVTHYFSGHGGGIEKVTRQILRQLERDEELHFTWIASGTDVPPDDLMTTSLLPVPCYNFLEKLFRLPLPYWGWTAKRMLRDVILQSDIVWLQDTLYCGNIAAFKMAKKYKKPIVITQHIAPIPYKNPITRFLMRMADKIYTSRMLRKADEVIFISDRVAEEYYRRVAFTRPIKVIPNGVNIGLFHAAIPENRRYLREQFALRAEQPVLLFVGRFVERKGMDVLRRLATLLPEWRFWLAGEGPINPDAWLLPNVHVFRNRSGQSLAELYQAADLFILPSYGEGFPLVVQEAMACGLPVLCGQQTAEGSRLAIPYLHTAQIWTNNPERTAAVWFDRLKSFPVSLPLKGPMEEVAEFAALSWDWPPIAGVYADMFKKLKDQEV